MMDSILCELPRCVGSGFPRDCCRASAVLCTHHWGCEMRCILPQLLHHHLCWCCDSLQAGCVGVLDKRRTNEPAPPPRPFQQIFLSDLAGSRQMVPEHDEPSDTFEAAVLASNQPLAVSGLYTMKALRCFVMDDLETVFAIATEKKEAVAALSGHLVIPVVSWLGALAAYRLACAVDDDETAYSTFMAAAGA